MTQPRLPRRAGRQPGSAVARVDWARVRELAEAGYRHGARMWGNLTREERAELWELIRRSRGNPRKLSRVEAQRLGVLLAKAARDGGR